MLIRCDVSNRDEIKSVAEKITKEVGDVTVLINNAGIMPCHSFTTTATSDIKKMFDINVFAHFWVRYKLKLYFYFIITISKSLR